MSRRTLHDIAHARAGDKGDSSILFVAPFDESDFGLLRGVVTSGALAAHFQIRDVEGITVRSLDALSALSIVIPHRLDGGVTRSATADPHGKTLSGHLLALPLRST
ncbi:AtuA-related protein [Microbacterium panaciterrae]|uniref:AtuA-like ferredoxin-fold domain-containing protein n=1 Tax=Microbacterium panaciterrae TaxID=985759 RepID=A0ABP8PUY4_9MICO